MFIERVGGVADAIVVSKTMESNWFVTESSGCSLVVEVVIKDSFVTESIGLFAASCPCWTNLID
jgi:hypothetical protein